MQYMGGKYRIAPYIMPIILAERKPEQVYVEPFVGGANTFLYAPPPRIGADVNKYLIAMLSAIRDGWRPPLEISRDEYYRIKFNKDADPVLAGYCGVFYSYRRSWFSGYAAEHDKYGYSGYNRVLLEGPLLRDSVFVHSSYDELELPPNSLIYCDPPYSSKKGYTGFKINHDHFWCWVKQKAADGHTIFVSELEGPDWAEVVWEKVINNRLSRSSGDVLHEKLFRVKSS